MAFVNGMYQTNTFISAGIRQGSPLSPLILAYINDISDSITVVACTFADDIS